MCILPYVHRYWASDTNDALLRINVRRGFTQFLPPSWWARMLAPCLRTPLSARRHCLCALP
jgi:alpha-galactosidase